MCDWRHYNYTTLTGVQVWCRCGLDTDDTYELVWIENPTCFYHADNRPQAPRFVSQERRKLKPGIIKAPGGFRHV